MKRFLIISTLFFSLQTFAQDTLRSTLDEVIITANKFPQKQKETGKVLTVITQQQLQQNSSHSLAELLNEQTGITVSGSSNNLGTNQTIYLRGAERSNTLILVDGIPVYDASGISSEFDLNFININQVERVEILKGAQSTLYGSDAVAGVINIIMKKPRTKAVSGFADISGGSYGTINTAAGINGTIKKWQYNLGYSFIHSNGFSSAYDSTKSKTFDNDAFTQHAINFSSAYQFCKQFNMRLFVQYNQYKTAVDEGAFTDDKDFNLHNKNFQVGTQAKWNFANQHFTFNYQYNIVNRSYLDDSTDVESFTKYQNGSYKSYSHFAEVYDNINLSKHLELLTGADFRHNATNQSYLSISDFGFYQPPPLSDDSAKTNQYSAYASFILKNISGFNLEVGARANNHSVYGWNGTYSFDPSYNINQNWRVFANISSAYHTPSLYQLYGEFGNKNLKPEQTQSYEAGIQFSDKIFQSRIIYFKRNIRSVISFYSDPITYLSYYINADKQKDNGIETELNINASKAFGISINYAYVDGKIETNSINTNKDTSYFNLYRRPRNVFNANISWQINKQFLLAAHLQTISKFYEPVYGFAPQSISGYYTINFYAEYKPAKNISLFTDARNITNQQYFDLPGYNSKRFNIMTGLHYNF
ncbi:MAG: TonB-dependent receptor plug domain-containing protein [Chitinophagaceae bacterium]